MPRRKTKNVHLPEYVTVIHGAYWYRPPAGEPGKPIRLGEAPHEEYKVWQWYGSHIAPQEPMGDNTTLKQCFDRYLKEVLPTKAPRTQKDYSRHIAKLSEKFGHLRPDELRKRDIGQFLDRPTGKIQANRQVAVLSAVYAKIVGRWYLAENNPCIGVERNESHRRTRYVTNEEYEIVWNAASPRVRVAMDLARRTGQRQGDILSLKWSEVTPEGVKFQQGKTGKKLLVARGPKLDEVLARARLLLPQIDIGGYVLRTRQGKPYTSEGFRAMWQRLVRRVTEKGLLKERFTFHDLRAKAVSDSKTLEEAFERAGHTSMAMTRGVYDRNFRLVKSNEE